MFADPKLQQELERVAVLRKLPAGAELMRAGDPITHIPIVRKGSLRILAQDPEGRERFLYHIMPGETCALSLTCCATKRTSSVMAVVEEDAELWMVPVMGFCQLALFGGYAIYFPELFPTRLRSTGTSFCYNVGRFIAAAGPLTLGGLTKYVFNEANGFGHDGLRYAGVAMCAVFLVGLFALPFAPETKGKPLPE